MGRNNNKKIRVLLSYFTFPPAANGVARYLGEISAALVKRGHNVEVICGDVKRKIVERQGKLRIHRLPFYSMRNTEDPQKRTHELLRYLIKLHSKNKIDLIEVQNMIGEFSIPYAMAFNIFSLMYNIPLVLRFHSMEINETQRSMARTLFWSKIISVCNKGTQAMYEGKIPVEKLETQINGVNLESFRSGLGKKWLRSRIDVYEKDFLVGTAGRIIGPLPLSPDEEDPTIEDKGIIDLIKAFANSLKDKKDAKLVIAAAAPPEDQKDRYAKAEHKIKELAKIMGIENKVIIKNFSLEEMPLFYNGLDIFALPSHAEAMPMTILEAMACKIPVVATSVGGIPELIKNSESGYLVEVKNIVELGKILRDLIKSPKKRENSVNSAYKNIQEKHDITKVSEKVIGIYKSIIEKQVKSPEKTEKILDMIKQTRLSLIFS